MTTKNIKLKNANGDYLEPYTENIPVASTTQAGKVQLDSTPTENSTNAVTSGGLKTALSAKLDTTATAGKATADASGNVITTTYATKTELSGVESTANTAKSIAEGRAQAKSAAGYSALITTLNAADKTAYKIGDVFYIQTQDVPDLWIYSVETTSASYTYSTDAALISAIKTAGSVQIGYFKVSALETEKVDLSGYVPTTRTVNSKALSANITLSAGDVGAVASNTAITGATKCKVTYDTKGLITAGADLTASDIPDLSATYLPKNGTATKATADANGNNIASTYAKLADVISYEVMS